MSKFDRILTPRLQIEVNLPNFDVRKSMVSALKRKNRRRELAAKPGDRGQPPEPTQEQGHPTRPPEPVEVNLDGGSSCSSLDQSNFKLEL